jgi:hypothetical protein
MSNFDKMLHKNYKSLKECEILKKTHLEKMLKYETFWNIENFSFIEYSICNFWKLICEIEIW